MVGPLGPHRPIARWRPRLANARATHPAELSAMSPTSGTANESARQDLLRQMLTREGLTQAGHEPIRRRTSGADAPLSPGQERIWFLDQLNPGNPFYSIHHSFRPTAPTGWSSG